MNKAILGVELNLKGTNWLDIWNTAFEVYFLASQDALEVMRVTYWVTHWALALTLLMWPWWVMIPIEDLTDVILITLVTPMKDI